jgi:thiol-disulfide isomerase/thioredoxin
LLLLAPDCPHCPTVLAALSELVKRGQIGRLEVINVAARPELAERLGVRTVPWVRLGPFELDGLRSLEELRQWAERAGTRAGMADYFSELLRDGQLRKVIELLALDPTQFSTLLLMLSNPDTELHVRVGIGAVMEEFEGRPALRELVDGLGELTRHPEPHVRGDACHYLALTHSPKASAYLQPLLHDPASQVRELAAESLAMLGPKDTAVG